MFYAPGLLGYSAVKIASPTFYSLRDSRTPVIVSVLGSPSNLGLNSCSSGDGLSAASRSARRIAAMFNAGVLLWLLRPAPRRPRGAARSPSSFVKILVASVVMGAASYFAADVACGRAAVAETWSWRAVRVSSARSAPACSCSWRSRAAAAHRRIRRRRRASVLSPARSAADVTALRTPPDHPADGQRPHDGRRLRQHLRAAAAAAHPAARPLARRGRHADDAAFSWRRRSRRSGSATSRIAGGRACSSWSARSSSVSVLSLVGTAPTSPAMLAVVLIVGGLGAAAFHPPAAALAHRLGGDAARASRCRSTSPAARSGFSLGPLMFAPFAQRFGLDVDAAARAARACWSSRSSSRACRRCRSTRRRAAASRAAAVREAARAALRHRRAADADRDLRSRRSCR